MDKVIHTQHKCPKPFILVIFNIAFDLNATMVPKQHQPPVLTGIDQHLNRQQIQEIDHTALPTPEPNIPQIVIIPPNITEPIATNTHSMVTSSKAGIYKPKALLATTEPTSVKSAITSPEWLVGMTEEYQALIRNCTWDLTPLSPQRKAISPKWIFKLKHNLNGNIFIYKAILVARGFTQEEDLDYTETFNPVVKPITIRMVLTIALIWARIQGKLIYLMLFLMYPYNKKCT